MIDALLPLALFALVTSITPGPNNLMLMASGLNFGFRRTIPHMLGIAAGFAVLLLLVGAGLVRLFELWPPLHTLLQAVAVLYLLYLAWRIAGAASPEASGSRARPFTVLEAALFQWVNPKAWTMALTAVTVYAPSESFTAILFVALVFSAINLPSVGLWAVVGEQARRLLTDARQRRVFNVTMAVLLVASLYPIVAG